VTRSELIFDLAAAALEGDAAAVQRLASIVADEEERIGHTRVAARLRALIDASDFRLRPGEAIAAPVARSGASLRVANRSMSDVQLTTTNRDTLRALIVEQRHARDLRAVGLEPRHRLLLTGAPGTGKTTVAEAVAKELGVPFRVIQYEDVIGSYLGETSSRLHLLFTEAATSPSVLFLDEFDTLAKERGDHHDNGEVKRVVSTLLLQIDALPSHVLVIAATNHQELLDRAAWRRFQVVIEMPLPDLNERRQFAEVLSKRVGLSATAELTAALDKQSSFADVENLVLDARRREVLSEYL
jgi:ATPases of the AAA+ class